MKKYLLIAFAFISLFSSNLFAHPHIFISQQIAAQSDKKGLSALNVIWTFDRYFSQQVVMDFDANHNNKFDTREIADVKRNIFDNLKQYRYFATIKIDNRPFEVKFVKNFTCSIKGDRVIYKFTIPCHVSAAPHSKHIKIFFMDPTYYTSILFADSNPLTTPKNDAFIWHSSVDENLTMYYFQKAQIEFKRRNK